MALPEPWQWVETAAEMITDYDQGQVVNQSQHNTVFMGVPGSGKNHTKAVIEEWGMRGDYIKTIYPHCTRPGHLQEVLQYTLPNGFFEERAARQQLETVKANLRDQEYDDATLQWEDLDHLLLQDDPAKVDALDELIREVSNPNVKRRLRTARRRLEEKTEKGDMIIENILENPEVPRPIRDAYDDGQPPTTNFEVEVFVPISFQLLDMHYPDFFTPFAIPVDDFKQYDLDKSLRIVFADNYAGHRKLYDKVVEVGDTAHADIKAMDLPDVDRDYVREADVAGETVEVYDPKQPTTSVKSFRRAWSQMFDAAGVVCSSDFEYSLRNQLKEALLGDRPDCIVLYTGFLPNSTVKKFVMTYFMETYRSIINTLSPAEQRGLDRKFVVSFLEAQEVILKKKNDRRLSEEDRQFNTFMRQYANQMRHDNSDFWVDVKPDDCHPLLLSRTQHTFLTRINAEDWDDLFRNRRKSLVENAQAAFMNDDYQQLRGSKYGKGFIIFSEGKVPVWTKSRTASTHPGAQTYGYRHLAPRMCVQREVEFSEDDPSFYMDDLGYAEMGRTIDFTDYKHALFVEDWDPAEQRPIAVKDKELEEERKEREQEEQTKKEYLQESVRAKLEEKVHKNGVPDAWSDYLREIKDELDIEKTLKTLRNWTSELQDELEAADETGQPADVNLDPEAVGEELMKMPRYVYGPSSKADKRRFAKRYIRDEYDVDDDVADQLAVEASSYAIGELKYEQIIGDRLHPKVDRDEFKEVMGLNVETAKETESVDENTSDEPDDDTTPETAKTATESEDEADDASTAEETEAPETEWTCTCGTVNEPDRSVCRNCETAYADVDDEDDGGWTDESVDD